MKDIKHLLNFSQWRQEDLRKLLILASHIKASPSDYANHLRRLSVVALFEKPSLRTRVSFEVGTHKMGGQLVYLDSQAGRLAGREDIGDMAANMSCWADAIVARVFDHRTLEQLAEKATVPVINALCDLWHPCQALADFLTVSEKFDDVAEVTLAYIGDGNNVCHSLMEVGAMLGATVVAITPPGYEPHPDIVKGAQALADTHGGTVKVSNDMDDAEGADVLYTDTWQSMGNETPMETLKQAFAGYQLNRDLLIRTGARYVMHCQPAHRDVEITSELIDGPDSLLLDQAENRMWAQNAILIHLLKG